MAQGGYIGHGVKVGFSVVASPPAFSRLEQVDDCVIPTLVADKIETTHHGTAGRIKRNIAGEQEVTDPRITLLRDANPVTSPIQNALFSYNNASTSLYWRVEIPTTANPLVDNLY